MGKNKKELQNKIAKPIRLLHEEIIEIAKNSNKKLVVIRKDILENTIYPLDESISFLQGLNAKIFFNNSNNFLAKLPHGKIKRELKRELNNQLSLYLEATKIYTFIMKLSKEYYDDLSLMAQEELDDFKEIELDFELD